MPLNEKGERYEWSYFYSILGAIILFPFHRYDFIPGCFAEDGESAGISSRTCSGCDDSFAISCGLCCVARQYSDKGYGLYIAGLQSSLQLSTHLLKETR